MATRKRGAGKSKECGCAGSGEAGLSLAEPMVAIVAREATTPPKPTAVSLVRLERVTVVDARPAFETIAEVPVGKGFKTACERGTTCIPWIRATRDPKKFDSCFQGAKKSGRVETSDDAASIFWQTMIQEDQEVFYVLSVDTQMFPRGLSEVARGARDRVQVPVPDVLRVPILIGATAFFVAHNHPSGYPRPSDADKELTKAIRKAGESAGIEMLDHLVIGARSYYSFRDGKEHPLPKKLLERDEGNHGRRKKR